MTTRSGRSPGNAVPPNTNVRKGGFDPAGTLTWETQVGFFTQWDSPPWMAVLGQDGFFDRFTVAMSRHSQALAITDREGGLRRPPPAGGNMTPVRMTLKMSKVSGQACH